MRPRRLLAAALYARLLLADEAAGDVLHEHREELARDAAGAKLSEMGESARDFVERERERQRSASAASAASLVTAWAN